MIKKGTLLYRVIAASGLKIIAAAEWLISKNSPNNSFFDTNAFPWTKNLEGSCPQIKDELHFVQKNRTIPDLTKLSEEQKRIIPENQWKTFIFCFYGNYVEENCQLCPITSSAIGNIPGIRGAFFLFLNRVRILPGIAVPIKGSCDVIWR